MAASSRGSTGRRYPRVDPRELVARLSEQGRALRERTLLAPLIPGARIRTRLDGLVYEFSSTRRFVGWGHFRPLNEREAEPIGEAVPWQRLAYLELFPALRIVLLWPDPAARPSRAWWALPYNESDARQRFGLGGAEPLRVYLCDAEDGAEPFARALARVDGSTLWYDGPDPLADPTHAAWLRDAVRGPEPPARLRPGLASSERRAFAYAWVHALDPVVSGPALASRQLESRLRRALAKVDAVLHGFREVPGGEGRTAYIVVEWSDGGATPTGVSRYRTTIDPALNVLASGICLSGRDGDFDLTSLVSVVAEAPAWSREEANAGEGSG
jgi:hypothetical protein